ncbi:hypothetical protein C8R43DRAFT_955834 [Mycena crocata]|nr:hypothetical protein C8R43DRAFT_955834 [Mycena crocata]
MFAPQEHVGEDNEEKERELGRGIPAGPEEKTCLLIVAQGWAGMRRRHGPTQGPTYNLNRRPSETIWDRTAQRRKKVFTVEGFGSTNLRVRRVPRSLEEAYMRPKNGLKDEHAPPDSLDAYADFRVGVCFSLLKLSTMNDDLGGADRRVLSGRQHEGKSVSVAEKERVSARREKRSIHAKTRSLSNGRMKCENQRKKGRRKNEIRMTEKYRVRVRIQVRRTYPGPQSLPSRPRSGASVHGSPCSRARGGTCEGAGRRERNEEEGNAGHTWLGNVPLDDSVWRTKKRGGWVGPQARRCVHLGSAEAFGSADFMKEGNAKAGRVPNTGRSEEVGRKEGVQRKYRNRTKQKRTHPRVEPVSIHPSVCARDEHDLKERRACGVGRCRDDDGGGWCSCDDDWRGRRNRNGAAEEDLRLSQASPGNDDTGSCVETQPGTVPVMSSTQYEPHNDFVKDLGQISSSLVRGKEKWVRTRPNLNWTVNLGPVQGSVGTLNRTDGPVQGSEKPTFFARTVDWLPLLLYYRRASLQSQQKKMILTGRCPAAHLFSTSQFFVRARIPSIVDVFSRSGSGFTTVLSAFISTTQFFICGSTAFVPNWIYLSLACHWCFKFDSLAHEFLPHFSPIPDPKFNLFGSVRAPGVEPGKTAFVSAIASTKHSRAPRTTPAPDPYFEDDQM